MESVKSKRFSFAGFSSSLSRSLSFGGVSKTESATPQQQPAEDDDAAVKPSKRAQKSKSLYIKSFKKVGTKEPPIKTTYDASEAVQSNSKDVRNSIRRSLSAVIYASPHGGEGENKLVPILVTPDLSDSVGGILVKDDSGGGGTVEKEDKAKGNTTEYDNSLDVFYSQKKDENDKSVTILWQGYGYIFDNKRESTLEELQQCFEKDVWSTYCGLIHPLHLVVVDDDDAERKWQNLSVNELRQYYDNYGSMMLKIRESRMLKQQKQYYVQQTQINDIL
ncbi:hypothetical protein [Parasitella parasitica]|uniref:Uncharacterized protein n=1 Tax=Parasitella parasitica TaxID=35722 RepID=A0A0B7MXU9_9FUNG|nr:hypothetical protein [Parasitella parasitica]